MTKTTLKVAIPVSEESLAVIFREGRNHYLSHKILSSINQTENSWAADILYMQLKSVALTFMYSGFY